MEFPMLFFISSLVVTLFHVVEELIGEGAPLWRYFGRIAGIQIPDDVGAIVFAGGLSLTLGIVAILAYCYEMPFFLGVLIGARVGDAIFSHWLLWIWYRPNPGLPTTLLFVGEVILILVFNGWGSIIGIALGMLFFASVIPVLRVWSVLQKQE